MDSTKQSDVKIHYCPLGIARGFPVDWNPEGRDPFVMSPQYPEILRKVAESRKTYKDQDALNNFDESKTNLFQGVKR